MNQTSKLPRLYIIILLLTIMTLAAFWQVLGHDFINYDDTQYVLQNPHVISGLTLDNILWAFKS
ncbi:MAG: hypothetical protein HY447_04075, partial [Candidatus Omnitrophica bacterium]|nr:hypothetical protein [Candidatus Omnitrophota bacterium]